MANRIIHIFSTISLWHFVWLAVAFSEAFTAAMSIVLRGRITYDYLITGAVVSLAVSSVVIFLIKLVRETEHALQETESRYRHLIDLSPDIIAIHHEGRFVYINDPGMRLLGAERPGQIIGKPIMDFVHSDYRSIVEERVRRGLAEGMKATFIEEKFLRLDGTVIDVEVTGAPFTHLGKPAMMVIARDITARKRSEGALQESEERYRNLFESAHDLIQSVSPEGRFLFVNRAWLETMVYTQDEVRKITIFDILHPSCRPHCIEIFRRVMSGEEVDNVEATFVAKDGRAIDVEGSVSVRLAGGKVIATQGIFRNVTERKKDQEEKASLEMQLRHSQKMKTVGALTARISHEFKNFLTTIIGYNEFIQDGMSKDDPLRKYADMVHAAATKADNLTRGLLAYSRKQVINPKPVKLNAIVEKVTELLSGLIGEDMELRSMPAGEDLIVMADSDQIEQVLMNLCMNAKDAMPGGGLLTLRTELAEMDEEFREVHGYGKPGKYALISVTDTGTGIDEKTRQKIFEPFFTTREPGKGTGLGLAVVYGIVKQHNGYIDLDSEWGKGTSFRVFLPLIELEG